MYERAFFIVNILNILICAYLIISIKRGGWISEMIFEGVTTKFIIPIIFFLTNAIINIIFGVSFINWILTFALLLVPGSQLLKESIEQKKTFGLYRRHEDNIKELVNNSLSKLKIHADVEDIKVFLTSNKEAFRKNEENDSCHVVIWLSEEQKSQTNSALNRQIESELKLAIKNIDFDVQFEGKKESK